jgi:hypothetical protein
LSGAVNLYDLVITSDASHKVSSTLIFGATTADFTLDFKDQNGNSFNPSDPLQVGRLESSIDNAFTNGVLGSDLTDIFTVGFVPRTTGSDPIGEYTVGGTTTATIGAVETPEPASITLLVIGALCAVPLLRSPSRRDQPTRGGIRVGSLSPGGSEGEA